MSNADLVFTARRTSKYVHTYTVHAATCAHRGKNARPLRLLDGLATKLAIGKATACSYCKPVV